MQFSSVLDVTGKSMSLNCFLFWDILRDCCSFFFICAVASLGFKVKMLRQFCKIGCNSEFGSLHKEFRPCSCTHCCWFASHITANILLAWRNHWIIIIIPLCVLWVEESETSPAEDVSSGEQSWACRSSIFLSPPEMLSQCKWPFPPAWLLTSRVGFVLSLAGWGLFCGSSPCLLAVPSSWARELPWTRVQLFQNAKLTEI